MLSDHAFVSNYGPNRRRSATAPSASIAPLTRAAAGPEVLAMVTDPSGNLVYVNPELLRVSGLTWIEASGRHWAEMFIPLDAREEVLARVAASRESGQDGGHIEAPLLDVLGLRHNIAWASNHSLDPHGRVVAITTVGFEVGVGTAPTRPLVAVPDRGGFDRLTGLADRDSFGVELQRHLDAARRLGRPLALILVNIDRFRSIVEILGHETGDALLREVAQRVQLCAGRNLVARISGDEFGVILPRVRTSSDALKVADCIINSMREACTSLSTAVHLGASAGIALYPHDANEPTTLLRNASIALRRTKDAGGDGHSLFHASLGERARDRMLLEQQLHGAVSRREIAVHYQPLVDATTHRVIGVEALARWTHPVLGAVPPARFIPVAEETGMIRSLGLHVLETALKEARHWRKTGLPQITMAVNVSARQLTQPDFADDVAAIIAATATPPGTLELEVTESAVLADIEAAADTLRQLADMGIAISLDDFGTGYSCIAQLNHLSVSTIKIDRSFLQASPLVQDANALVRALVALARSLNLRVIAEGVETAEQLLRLEPEGCDVYQGFLFSRPLPVNEIRALLARGGALG